MTGKVQDYYKQIEAYFGKLSLFASSRIQDFRNKMQLHVRFQERRKTRSIKP